MSPLSTERLRTARTLVAVALAVCLVGASAFAVGATTSETRERSIETPDERADAERIEPGTTVEANVSSGSDVDWYAVNVTAGEAVVPHLTLQNDSDGRSLVVELYGPNGTAVGEEKADAMGGPENVAGEGPLGGQDARAVAPNVATSNATYYVKVSESEYASTDGNVTSAYNLTVETKDLDRFDPNENGSTATHVGPTAEDALNGSMGVDAVATPYDRDVYAVTLAADTNYTVTLAYTNGSDADRYPKQLRLFANASAVPADDSPDTTSGEQLVSTVGDNETVTFTVEETGTYYLHLGQASTTNELLDEDGYRLTIERGTPDEDASEEEEDEEEPDNVC